MRTNVINGAFILGHVKVEESGLSIISSTDQNVQYSNVSSGTYPVIAETDLAGFVNYIVIDVQKSINIDYVEVDKEDFIINMAE
ncbi:hypothetical protein CR205_11170 [Alteribacter lacisalsi]|uniref:Uncharacterized protein n=1 Tax=Alteribacter lacisalsi TaxID=2045244 RepID=A0A2W0HD13_9BACI|nr:hypothetical protein [Alteribacter lacisalsi]PYZ99087.1 hypothetical protein CR205_11170 [Alteribacter lacisalsi]